MSAVPVRPSRSMNATRADRRCRAALPAETASLRLRSLPNPAAGPAPMSATRRARHDRSVTVVTKKSYGRAANSFDAIARATSPPVAASSEATAAGPSPSNHGTTSRSVSMVASGAPVQAITTEGEAVVDIALLSLMRLARPNRRRYNASSQPSAQGPSYEQLPAFRADRRSRPRGRVDERNGVSAAEGRQERRQG